MHAVEPRLDAATSLRLLSLVDIANELGRSLGTARKVVAEPGFPPAITVCRRRYWRHADVARWFDDQTTDART